MISTNEVAFAFCEPRKSGERVWIKSTAVADLFGKEPKNVNLAIRKLECSASFRRLNFKPVSIVEKNASGADINRSYYLISKDGFMFLAMGFTGKKAAQFKELLIQRFNLLESFYNEREHKHREAYGRLLDSSIRSMIDAGYSKSQIKQNLAPTSADRDGRQLADLKEVFGV